MDPSDRDPLEAQLSAYLDDELSPEGVTDIERRIASDPDVRTTFESLRRTIELIRSLPRHPAPPGVLDDLTEAAERDQLLESGGESASSLMTRWQGIRSLLATAAVVTITVGAGLWFASRNVDTNRFVDDKANLAQGKDGDIVKDLPTPSGPSDSSKGNMPRTITKQALALAPADPTDERRRATVKDSPTRRSSISASPITQKARNDLRAETSPSQGSTRVESGFSGPPRELAPSNKLDEASTMRATQLSVPSDALTDSLVLRVANPPASMTEPRREHVLPLSFVCAGSADLQACEFRLRTYLEALEPSSLVLSDTLSKTRRGSTRTAGIVGTVSDATSEGRSDMDEDPSPWPGGQAINAASREQSPPLNSASHPDRAGYTVRVPASELLQLIDRVSSAAQAEVVPELQLGQFTVRGRGRIEELLDDSRFLPVARRTPVVSEVQTATAQSSHDELPSPTAHAATGTGVAAAERLGDRSAGDAGQAPTSPSRSVRRPPGGATGVNEAKSSGKSRTVTKLAAAKSKPNADAEPLEEFESNSETDQAANTSLPAMRRGARSDFEPNSAETQKESSTHALAENTWFTLIISFVDSGTFVGPPQFQPEASPVEFKEGASGVTPVAPVQEAPEEAAAGETKPPGRATNNTNSSP